MKTLTVVTITNRPGFLPSVARSMVEATLPIDGYNLRWLVKFNQQAILPWAEHIRIWDETLRSLRDTWFLLVSDDNLLHVDLPRRWSELISSNPHAKAIHLDQQWGPNKNRLAGQEYLHGGMCDTGQVLFDADYYNSFGYAYDQFGFEGNLFRKIWKADPSRWLFVNEPLTFHDRQMW